MLLLFQGLDTASKDSAIQHVMAGVNPQSCSEFESEAARGGLLVDDAVRGCASRDPRLRRGCHLRDGRPGGWAVGPSRRRNRRGAYRPRRTWPRTEVIVSLMGESPPVKAIVGCRGKTTSTETLRNTRDAWPQPQP